MTDYTKRTGSSGIMLIRDTGTYVEFWVTANNTVTYNERMPWAFVVNGGASVWLYYNYKKGSGYERLYRENVTYSQTVTFKLGDTGTAGLGGPTTFSVYIARAKAPSAPTFVSLSDIASSSAYVVFKDGSNNGASIDSRQIGYGHNESTPQKTVTVNGTSVFSPWGLTITGLTPGTRAYFWGRTHNSKGWSPWSPRYAFTTQSVVRINVNGTWRNAIPYVKTGGVWKVTRPWTRSGGIWREVK